MHVSLTIFKRGLILVSVPLLFQLAFIGLLVWVERAEKEADAWVDRTQDVVLQTHLVLEGLLNAEAGMRGFVLTADPAFAEPFEMAFRNVPDALSRLETLVHDPDQGTRVRVIAAQAGQYLAWQAENGRLVRGGERERAVARGKTGDGKRQMDAIREGIEVFLQEQKRLEVTRRLSLGHVHQWYGWLLIAGTAGSVTITVLLGLVFSCGIGRRLATLTENARRLAQGKELAPALTGSDEIVQVDRAFRDMEQQLAGFREALQKQTRTLQLILDSMGDGVVVADANGKFLIFNPAAERTVGLGATPTSPDEWTDTYGVFLPDAVTPLSTEEQPLVRAIRGEHSDRVELFIRNPKVPEGLWINVTGRPLRDARGVLHGGVVVFRDVTQQKRAAEEIRELNEKLEQRVLERTAELAEANRELAQKNQENEMFVYSVSHDLRSPLVNLQGFSEELSMVGQDLRALLADDHLPPAVRDRGLALLDGDMAESMRFIQTGVMRLSGIIDALLRLSRAGRVEYRWQQVEVEAVVARVVESLNGTVVERGATVTVAELPPAWGDPTAVEQIFANLIGNALNYLDPGRPGSIEVGSSYSAERAGVNGHAVPHTYYVRDNGLGIPEAYRPKVFQAFQRLHPDVAKGEGVGLVMVRRIVERHGGRIWLESAEGIGTTFFLTLTAHPLNGAAADSKSGGSFAEEREPAIC